MVVGVGAWFGGPPAWRARSGGGGQPLDDGLGGGRARVPGWHPVPARVATGGGGRRSLGDAAAAPATTHLGVGVLQGAVVEECGGGGGGGGGERGEAAVESAASRSSVAAVAVVVVGAAVGLSGEARLGRVSAVAALVHVDTQRAAFLVPALHGTEGAPCQHKTRQEIQTQTHSNTDTHTHSYSRAW